MSPRASVAVPCSAKRCGGNRERAVPAHCHRYLAALHAGSGGLARHPSAPGHSGTIPDAVYLEATRVRGAPGADRIVEWINDHLNEVRIVPTDIGIDQQRRLEEGRSIRGLGEQAAIEALERFLRSDTASEALLLFEDTDMEKRRAVVDERVGLITTGDFLRELEAAGLVQSSDRILDLAAARGRNVERQRLAAGDDIARERFRPQLQISRDKPPGGD